jgi:hypothetical protein
LHDLSKFTQVGIFGLENIPSGNTGFFPEGECFFHKKDQTNQYFGLSASAAIFV